MKNKFKAQIKCFILIALVSFLGACDTEVNNDSQAQQPIKSSPSISSEFRVTNVNDFQFLYNDTEIGGIINFSSVEFQQCTLAFVLAKFEQGFEAVVSESEEGVFDITCLSEEDNFTLNENDDTHARMKVDEVNQRAKITLSFSLIGWNSEKLITKKNISLILNNEQLKTLRSR